MPVPFAVMSYYEGDEGATCVRIELSTNLLRVCSVVLIAIGLLAACSTPPDSRDGLTQRDGLSQQIEQVESRASPVSGSPRLLLGAFALDDRSQAFQHDALLAQDIAAKIDPNTLSFELDNSSPRQTNGASQATRENIERVVAAIAALARPQDKVLLVFSSHGKPGSLAIHAGGENIGTVSPADLARWLAPLRDRPTMLIISACYSGSFIDALAAPNRIILTAAARNRMSFGCSSRSDNTYFIKELLAQSPLQTLSIRELMRRASEGVIKRELQMRLRIPSEPQYFFGSGVEDWSNQALQDWVKIPVLTDTQTACRPICETANWR